MKEGWRAIVFIGAILLAAVSVPHPVNPAVLPDVPAYRVKGAAKPKVVITEFSDFQCPNCSSASSYLLEMIKQHRNDVAVVFRHYPLRQHRWSFLAAQASECAGAQGKFWEYQGLLFENQAEWHNADDARELFVEYAESIGLDAERFSRDLDGGRFADAVQRDIAAARDRNVNVTPTFFINERRLVGDRQLRAYGNRFVELEKLE